MRCTTSNNQTHAAPVAAFNAREALSNGGAAPAESARVAGVPGVCHNQRRNLAAEQRERRDAWRRLCEETVCVAYCGDAWALYVIARPDSRAVKIGISRDVAKRLRQLQAANDEPLTLLLAFHCDAQTAERELHRRFDAHRKRGEWFDAVPDVLGWVERQRERCREQGYGRCDTLPPRRAPMLPWEREGDANAGVAA